MAQHIDRSRSPRARARSMTRRSERRIKSFLLFAVLAFAPVGGED